MNKSLKEKLDVAKNGDLIPVTKEEMKELDKVYLSYSVCPPSQTMYMGPLLPEGTQFYIWGRFI